MNKMTNIKIKLFEHQIKCVNWLKTHDGLILYHSMGSGKTITSLAMVSQFKFPIIIIATKASRKNFTDDIEKIINRYADKLKILDFQLQLDRHKKCSELNLIIASCLNKKVLQSHSKIIIRDILENYPAYKILEKSGQVAPLQIVWVKENDLNVNPKTGKLLRIVDKIN